MSVVKKIAGIVVLIGIGVLTATGATEANIGVIVTIGVGAGTAIGAVVGFLKKT